MENNQNSCKWKAMSEIGRDVEIWNGRMRFYFLLHAAGCWNSMKPLPHLAILRAGTEPVSRHKANFYGCALHNFVFLDSHQWQSCTGRVLHFNIDVCAWSLGKDNNFIAAELFNWLSYILQCWNWRKSTCIITDFSTLKCQHGNI